MRQVFLLLLVSVLSAPLAACGADDSREPSSPPDARAACEALDRPLPIPFDHSLSDDALTLLGGERDVRVYIGPWGAHAQPHTGHPEGNWKADWAAPTAYGYTDPLLARLPFGGPDGGAPEPGACVPGALCGVHVDAMRARLAPYALPDAVEVVRVALIDVVGEGDDPLQDFNWEIEVEYCPYRITFGHVSAPSDALADAMLAVGYDDPRHLSGPRELLGHGDAPIALAAHTAIGLPQVLGRPVDGWPDYRQGRGTLQTSPWAEIEWTAVHVRDSAEGLARPEYAYMSEEARAHLEALLLAQRSDPDVFRYAEWARWLWLADAELVLATEWALSRTSTESIFDRLGGWYEQPRDAPCDPYSSEHCDEAFAIWPARDDSPYFDASRYLHDDVRYFVMRGPHHQYRFGEVIAPAAPDPRAGSLRVAWRTADGFDEAPQYTGYQSIGYRLEDGVLRLDYGPEYGPDEVEDPMGFALIPPPGGVEGCDGNARVCMTSSAYGRR